MQRWLAIDIGGTNVAAAVVTDDGQISGICTETTRGSGNEEMGEQLQNLLFRVCRGIGISPGEFAGVGVAVPGSVDRDGGIALGAVNLGFSRLPVAEILSKVAPVPVAVENDANAGALGEKWFGAGQDCDDFAYVAVGTGVGGGLVLGGRLHLGARGVAGEIGHCIVDPNGLRCRCGSIGCLESMASGVGIPRLAAKVLGEKEARTLGHGNLPAPPAIYSAAAAGHTGAREVVAEVGKLFAVAVATLFRLLDVERVIVSGGVAMAGEPFLQAIYDGANNLGFTRIRPGSVVLSSLGGHANLFGAAAVVKESVRAAK